MMVNKAAFFDRDGTLITDVNYLSQLNQIEIIPQAIALARECQEQGYKLFIVTNQSGIARGYFSESFVEQTNARVHELFAQHGIFFEKSYFCPHHEREAVIEMYKKACDCRKPKPGMLLTAAQEFSIDLSQSLMFGDKPSDLSAGTAAGCQSFDVQEVFNGSYPDIFNGVGELSKELLVCKERLY